MKKSFLLIFISVLLLSGCSLQQQKVVAPTITPTPTPEVKMIKEGEGPVVDLIPRADKQVVTLKISGISSEIKKVDYEMVYDTNGLQRGVVGSVDMKNGEDKIVKELTLGSCSKGVCVFDKNITKIQLTVKFTTSGEPLEFQKEYVL